MHQSCTQGIVCTLGRPHGYVCFQMAQNLLIDEPLPTALHSARGFGRHAEATRKVSYARLAGQQDVRVTRTTVATLSSRLRTTR